MSTGLPEAGAANGPMRPALVNRRTFTGAAAATLLAGCTGHLKGTIPVEEPYGLIGEMKAAPGKRDELVAHLLEGTRDMPGNLAYIVARDASNPDSIWITEVWRTKADHANSLSLPGVQAAIAKARPIMAGFGLRVETVPVGIDG